MRTYDPRKPPNGPWSRFAKIAAALAVVAGALVAVNTIVEVFKGWKPKTIEPQLRVGWLTVGDPQSLACVIKPGNTFRLQKDGPVISQADNDCYAQLRQQSERLHQGPQALGKSYFLYIQNMGEPIETLTLYKKTASPDGKISFRSLDKGAAISICMGYDGRSGLLKSRLDGFDEIEVVRSKTQRSVTEVPDRNSAAGRGASDCEGPVDFRYPLE